jgi:aminocarboxymuconate-semialdehyde decarboxylase
MGLDLQAISPMPELLSYWMPADAARQLTRFLNGQIGEMVSQSRGRLVGPPPLQQVLAYPTDVGLAAASVVTGGLIARRPQLRIAFSHGGGSFASLLPRLQQGWGVFAALREQLATAPAEQARRLFYDTLVFDEPTLRHLVTTFGDTQLMAGSDYPFNFHDATPVARIERAGLPEATVQRLVRGNAERFLGLAS